MFKKTTSNVDFKKSQQKCIDVKRDLITRLKHLKASFENGDYAETKHFLESNYSIIFNLFFDSFLNAEAYLKQKGAFAVQRSYREDLECCLYILDRILCLLPDLIKKKWQCNALTHIFKKLLHPGNTLRLKGEAMRLFILWYMIIGDQKTPDMDCIFASLVHGFPVPPPPVHELDVSSSKVTGAEISFIIPPANTEKTPDELSSYMLRSLLEFMVSQARRVDWNEQKSLMHSKSFSYIFMMFRSIYLPYIFPNFNPRSSVYKPSLELPELRTSPGPNHFGSCPVVLVDWVKKYISPPKKVDPTQQKKEDDRRKSAHVESHEAGSNSDQDSITSAYYTTSDEAALLEDHKLVHDILLLSRENVNFIHELFRQALRLCFRYSSAMKSVIQCYCDWIKMTNSEVPSFMLEPKDMDHEIDSMRRLRNDSYIGAVNSDLHVRAGLQNILQFFVTSACNVFLLVVSPDYPRLLDEQVELCKLILNIYRYMVMNTRMEQQTWEQLLLVLFHITAQTLKGKLIKHKDSLGRRFASALFQTLIVSCIKANLSVVISGELWNQLLSTLVSLTHWEELIKEWAKTMDTLTKVLARHVYGLELDNLPLDRLTERNALKRAATKGPGNDSSRNTLSRVLDNSKFNVTRSAQNIVGVSTSTGIYQGYHGSSPLHNECSVNRFPDDYSKQNLQRSPFNRGRRRNSLGSSSSQKFGGTSDCTYGRSNSESYPYEQSSQAYYGQSSPYYSHHYTHQQKDGYYRHSVTSRYKMLKSSSDPSLFKQSFEEYRVHVSRHVLSRSLNYIPYGSEDHSRSASPAPSSGIETSSLKESPLQMDIGGDTVSLDTLDGGLCTEQRSVMAGGTVRGWLPDVSVILWRRVLGLLGDPNDVGSPQIHEQIFKYLNELTDKLIKLRNNQGISIDNQTTPEPPDLVPPLLLLAPWCFKSFTLPDQFNTGKILAYQILCKMLVRKQDVTLPTDLLAHFYRVLHQGLVGPNQIVISTLVGGCSPYFFSLELQGSSMLALDFIYATNTVISSNDPKLLSARFDALSLLGSLYPIASLYPKMPVLQPSPSDFVLIECSEVKDHLINVLLKCAKRDSYAKTRSLALCALSVYIYHELSIEAEPHHKVTEAVNVLLASLKPSSSTQNSSKSHFHTSTEIGRLVSQISSDMLLLLADLADTLLQKFPDLPPKIVQVLCQTLSSISVDSLITSGKEGQFLILSLLFCLGEWVMHLPQRILLQPSFDNKPILHLVFKMLHIVAVGANPSGVTGGKHSSQLETIDVDPIIKEDAESKAEQFMGSKDGTMRKNNGVNISSSHSTVKLAARTLTNHIVNHLWHFPLCVGAQHLSSLVVENDDLPGVSSDELTSDIFNSRHVQMFALNNSCLMSLIQLPSLQVPGGASTVGFKTPSSEVRLILRDLSGKFSWDASTLYAPPSEDFVDCSHSMREDQSPVQFDDEEDNVSEPISPKPSSNRRVRTQSESGMHGVANISNRSSHDQAEMALHGVTNLCHKGSLDQSEPALHGLSVSNVAQRGIQQDMTSSIMITAPPRHTLRHRPIGVLPSVEDSADDLDNIDDLLSYIGYSSPEVLEQFGQPLNEVVAPPGSILNEIQTEAITAILNQRNLENEYLFRHADDPSMACPREHCPLAIEADSTFQQCRKLFDQLGLASFEKRKSIHTLRKNEKLLREIKNLDNQKCRETHKVAVIYVAGGQEDKISILSNSAGSEEFEEFVSGLGWEVELATHSGFLGGLQRNGSTGETAPYYATSLAEVIFHVSTRMPSNSEESSFQKIRHLGNDEVHIVWSEHERDYRRGIIPTEFGDVLIIIYPLANKLFRIHISTKPDVPLFGPLFDGAIINRRVLSKLVRATAINASRAKRSRLPMYQHFYEERARSLETIVGNHSEATTFEHFLSDVYCPVSSFSSAGTARTTGSASVCSSTLAAALIDRPSQSSPRPPLTRPTSYSVGEHHNVREKVRSALGNDTSGYGTGESTAGGSGRSSASPKGYKKQSFKVPRKMGIASGTPTTSVSPMPNSGGSQTPSSRVPPESPVPPPRKNKDIFLHSPRNK